MQEDFTISELKANPEIYWLGSQIEEKESTSAQVKNLKELFEGYYGDCLIKEFQLFPSEILKLLLQNNRLDEVGFHSSFFDQEELSDLRKELKLETKKDSVILKQFRTDIFTLGGSLARMLAQGGPYAKLSADEAWSTSLEFVKSEFDDRFKDVLFFDLAMPDAEWFDRIAWDYCFLLVDKKTFQVLFLATTGTD